jgi:uncharacterized RDD family membrane protein YckC
MGEATSFCNQCGAQNVATAEVCGRCGVVQTRAAAPVAIPPMAARRIPVAPATRYAGFWIRFVAALIDVVVLQIVTWPLSHWPALMQPFSYMHLQIPWLGFQSVHLAGRFVFGLLAKWLYEASMESSPKQGTLGKMALSLRVIDLEGNRISFARASARHFAKLISLIFFVGFIMAGFTERKQALHDMIVDTLVLRVRS